MDKVVMNGDLISRKALLGKLFPYGMPDNGNYGINARAVRDAVVGAKAVEAEPVVHAHWNGDCCSRCGELAEENYPRCPYCGAHMDELLELRTCYCPICDKHFEVRSNDSMGDCPDCGHHVVLHMPEVWHEG